MYWRGLSSATIVKGLIPDLKTRAILPVGSGADNRALAVWLVSGVPDYLGHQTCRDESPARCLQRLHGESSRSDTIDFKPEFYAGIAWYSW